MTDHILVQCAVPVIPGIVYAFTGQQACNGSTGLLTWIRDEQAEKNREPFKPVCIPGVGMMMNDQQVRISGHFKAHFTPIGGFELEFVPEGFRAQSCIE